LRQIKADGFGPCDAALRAAIGAGAMTVSDDDIRLVRESLPRIRERLVPASTIFYENLFAVAPDLRALFRPDLATQGMRFMSTLATIADVLGDPEELGAELDDLARAHARVGVRAEHFKPMGAALLVTLGETLGSEFTSRLQEAWRHAYDHFAAEMIARGRFD
jgi:nitric oxide dioxygenase